MDDCPSPASGRRLSGVHLVDEAVGESPDATNSFPVHNSGNARLIQPKAILLLFKITHDETYSYSLAVAVVSLFTACSPDLQTSTFQNAAIGGFHVDAGIGTVKALRLNVRVEQTAKMPVIVSALPQAQNEPLVEQHYSVPVVEAQPPVVASNETVTQVKHTRSTPAAVDATLNFCLRKNSRCNPLPNFSKVKQAAKRFFHPQEDVPFWLLIVLHSPSSACGFSSSSESEQSFDQSYPNLIFWLPGVIYALIVVTR